MCPAGDASFVDLSATLLPFLEVGASHHPCWISLISHPVHKLSRKRHHETVSRSLLVMVELLRQGNL